MQSDAAKEIGTLGPIHRQRLSLPLALHKAFTVIAVCCFGRGGVLIEGRAWSLHKCEQGTCVRISYEYVYMYESNECTRMSATDIINHSYELLISSTTECKNSNLCFIDTAKQAD